MIETLVTGHYDTVEFHHVRLGFSRELTEVGRFKLRKIRHLLSIVIRVASARLRTRSRVLLYPPAGQSKAAIYRDIVILIATRWMFEVTVFHFHAEGLVDVYLTSGRFVRFLMRCAYAGADADIRMAGQQPSDLSGRSLFVVPYGIEDLGPPAGRSSDEPTVLFVGTLRESKGVEILVRAFSEVYQMGLPGRLRIVGVADDDDYLEHLRQLVSSLGISEYTDFSGLLTGQDKLEAYNDAELFCFPTFYESEAFPVVILEAMRASLPVLSTNWRFIPSLVRDGETGVLVEPRDLAGVTAELANLLRQPERRRRLGQSGRELFESTYTVERYRNAIESALTAVAREQRL